MLNAFFASLGAGALERITLLLNHVIASETVATDRLKPHAGRSVQLTLTGWPSLLPAPPQIAFRITPAGLLEWCGNEPPADPLHPADLRLTLDASNPARLAAQWLAGQRPKVGIEGDATFAADVSWLIDNLRWDLQDDLAKVIGPAPAHELSRFAAMVAGGLREAVHVLRGLAERRGSPR